MVWFQASGREVERRVPGVDDDEEASVCSFGRLSSVPDVSTGPCGREEIPADTCPPLPPCGSLSLSRMQELTTFFPRSATPLHSPLSIPGDPSALLPTIRAILHSSYYRISVLIHGSGRCFGKDSLLAHNSGKVT